MNAEIQKLWDVYNARKNILLCEFIRIARTNNVVGQADAWGSRNLSNMISGLVLIDLTSVFDEALKLRVGKKGMFSYRLERAKSLGLLQNVLMLESMRDKRNEVAHEMLSLKKGELESYHNVVYSQLEAWDYIGSRMVVPCILQTPTDWHRDGIYASRKIEIGVIDGKTHKRIWGWDITQSIQLVSADAPIESAQSASFEETRAKFYE